MVYGSSHFCAKELTVFPGRAVTITDPQAYGLACSNSEGYREFTKKQGAR